MDPASVAVPFDTSLPVVAALPELRAALGRSSRVILTAPPGAGKTTVVPPALLDEPWLAGKKLLVLEPRRLAARAAAARIAELLGEPVGRTAGYRTRFDAKVSAATRIEVLTEGILTRRLQRDPELAGVGLVVFDEFHERHLQTDLGLALTLDAQEQLRPDLKLLVMSATLDTQPLAALLGGAPVVATTGRQYPVAIRYLDAEPKTRLAETAAAAALRAWREEAGDLLVFLPGRGEIERVCDELTASLAGTEAAIIPLHGGLARGEQDRALIADPRGRRKIVVATPIAETSLTIPGVRVVIDSGWMRAPRFEPRTGMGRLDTVRVAKANAEQRAGRAGRLAPGTCYRLYSRYTFAGLLDFAPPEITIADLAPLALDLAAWGVAEPGELHWLDPPPAGTFAAARELLRGLGAIDGAGRITAYGKRLAEFPLHPRLANMLLRAKPLGWGARACELAAFLGEREGGSRGTADLAEAVAAARHQEPIARAADELRRRLEVEPAGKRLTPGTIGLLAAFGYPDRVARRREPGKNSFLLANGRGARFADDHGRDSVAAGTGGSIAATDDQSFRGCDLLVAASLTGSGTESVIRGAAPLAEAELRRHFADQIVTTEIVSWDSRLDAVRAEREERFGALVLDRGALPDPPREQVIGAMLAGIRALGLAALPWTPECRQWQARVLSLRAWHPDGDWPEVTDAALVTTLADWLAPHLEGITRRAHLVKLDLLSILNSRLDWKQQRELDRLAPERMAVPSGAAIRLEYQPDGSSPVLAVKLQEMFGLADTPRVGGGQVPVLVHLLSPARRPLQVTRDLRSFWATTYPEVKKELKGRYPKHPWPDDPWTAKPTARTTKHRKGQGKNAG